MNPIISPDQAKRPAAEAIRREVHARWAEKWRQVSIWERMWLWFVIEREISAELKRRFPPTALFVRRSTR